MDGISSARAADGRDAQQTMMQLQGQLAELDAAYQELAAKDAMARDKLSKAEQLIRTVAGATTEHEMETPAPQPRQIEGEGFYMKKKLREILGEGGRVQQPQVIQQATQMRATPRAMPQVVSGGDDWPSLAMRNLFDESDRDRDGRLQWNAGEIRHFITQCLEIANHKKPDWNDWDWYTMYRSYDKDGSLSMDWNECCTLARAIRDAAAGGPQVQHMQGIQATVVQPGMIPANIQAGYKVW